MAKLNRFRRYKTLFRTGLLTGALGECCAAAAGWIAACCAVDYGFNSSVQARMTLLIMGIIGFVSLLGLALYKALKQTSTPASALAMERFMNWESGRISAALEFQSKLDNSVQTPGNNALLGSSELARQAIDSLEQDLNSDKLNGRYFLNLPLRRWGLEAIVLAIFAGFLSLIPDDTVSLAITRFFNPYTTQGFTPASADDLEKPVIESISLRVIPPAATMKSAFNLDFSDRNAVPAGSTIKFRVQSTGNVPVKSAYCILSQDEHAFQSNEQNPGVFTLSLPWNETQGYKIRLEGVNGAIEQTGVKTIEALPDAAPKTALFACQLPDMEVVSDALIPLTIFCQDDYGVVSTSIRWRLLKEEEIVSGEKPKKIVYQRQPVWDAFQDDSITRPPRERTEETALNLQPMELAVGAQLDVLGQSVDTRMEESDSSVLRLIIVDSQQINTILISARLRLASELRRAGDTLEKAQKDQRIEAVKSMYAEFDRQLWNEKDGAAAQIRALVQRVKMNHLPWGRTLVELDSAGRKLNALQSVQGEEIQRLFAILNLDSSDTAARESLNNQLQNLAKELEIISRSFGQWTQYRELVESLKTIQISVREMERQTRAGFNVQTQRQIHTIIPQIASQTQQWRQAAAISGAAYTQADASQYPQAQSWSDALNQAKRQLDISALQPIFAAAIHTDNSTASYAAVIKLREIYDQALAILNASGDDAAQRRLLLKAELEQIYEIQKSLNQNVKIIRESNPSEESDSRQKELEISQCVQRQKELAARVESLHAAQMTVVSDALFQTRSLMYQAADFIEQKQPQSVLDVCQNAVILHLEQILEMLNQAEQLAILALNEAKESLENPDKQKDANKKSDDIPAGKVAIEDLKLLEISQRELLAQTRQAYSDALESGSLTVSPETAAILSDKQQRLASLTYFLMSISTPKELLRGERPKETPAEEAPSQSDDLDDDLLGDLTAEVVQTPLTAAQKVEQEQQAKEQEFIDSLWTQLGTAAVSEEDAPLLEIVRFMRQTFELFKLKDCGEINQGLQEQICDHFNLFINQISFGKEKQKTQDDKNQTPPKDDSENNSDDKSQDEQTASAAAPEEGEKTSDGDSAAMSEKQRRELQRKFWGELPPEIQKAAPVESQKLILPEYQNKIDAYWKQLGE